MQRRIILLVFLLGICGCAPEYHWAKAVMTQQEWTKDTYESERSAKERAYYERGFMGTLTVQHFFDQCLSARGYEKE